MYIYPSFERSLVHNCYNLKKNFKIIGSAHNLFEMNIKKQNISEVFSFYHVFKKKADMHWVFMDLLN